MTLKNKKLLKELNSYPFYKVIRSKQKTNFMLKKKFLLFAKSLGSLRSQNIKKHKRERINWVTFNNNFILFNSDEKVKGFSYQVINDTLFLRQPEDNLEFFVRNDKKKSEQLSKILHKKSSNQESTIFNQIAIHNALANI